MSAAVPPLAVTVMPLAQLTVFGTPEQCRAQFENWYEAGAELPMVFLRPNLTPDEIDFTLSAFR
jgi:alkanesulfonate monooxygenase SsuD/methylene tetrahydromethanopterin reductase-like flavin-dependent oxidoreductase (luciferase family)